MDEGYKGVGRQKRRLVVKLWKESGTGMSLKEWAAQTGAGHVAHVWMNAKKGKSHGLSTG